MTKQKIKQIYCCNQCESPIMQPEHGYIITGNITTASVDSPAGYIGGGKWLSDIKHDHRIVLGDIPETILCKKCLLEILNIKFTTVRKTNESDKSYVNDNDDITFMSFSKLE